VAGGMEFRLTDDDDGVQRVVLHGSPPRVEGGLGPGVLEDVSGQGRSQVESHDGHLTGRRLTEKEGLSIERRSLSAQVVMATASNVFFFPVASLEFAVGGEE